jgi:hypothetical protein
MNYEALLFMLAVVLAALLLFCVVFFVRRGRLCSSRVPVCLCACACVYLVPSCLLRSRVV